MVEWVHGPQARGRGAAALSGLGGQAWALVGTARTVLVAVTGHLVATLVDAGWVRLGPPVGVPLRYLSFGSAGPSVAVVALLAYLAVVRRVAWLAVAIGVYDVAELVVFNG